MGMGEPLHNYDNLITSLRILTNDKGAKLAQRRITVSTSGLVPKLEKLGNETVRPNLAVSLNAPNDAMRDEIMPINRKWNIGKLLAALKAYPLEQRRRITFEYVLLAGVNDSLARRGAARASCCAASSARSTSSRTTRTPRRAYARPRAAAVEAFQNECKRLGMSTYLRIARAATTSTPRAASSRTAATARRVVPLRIRKGPPPPPPVE